jgi:hypothetical protein
MLAVGQPAVSNNSEFEYLRACLASRVFSERPFPAPPANLDWERFYSLLTRQRLSSHFYVLAKSHRDKWPASFHEQLRLDRYSLMVYGRQCSNRIQTILAALTQAGIPIIVLKGWAFIQTLYDGDPSQRICSDIDLLVHPRDVSLCEGVFYRSGCQLERESWPGYNHRYLNGNRFFFPGQPVIPGHTFSIGFHWGLLHVPAFDPKQVNIERLFEQSHPINVCGAEVRELAIEDAIVYNCAHLDLHHRFEASLLRYYEIGAIIARAGSSLDWEGVIQHASLWKKIVPLRIVLEKIEILWPGIILTSILDRLARQKPNRIERFVNRWIEKTNGRPAFDHLLLWLTFPDWKQRPLILLQDIFPSPAYMNWRYGRPFLGIWPFLYLRRFARAFDRIKSDAKTPTSPLPAR